MFKDVQSRGKASTGGDANRRGRISMTKNRTAAGESIQDRRLHDRVPVSAKG